MDIHLIKTPAGHIVPSTPWDAEKLERFKTGEPFKAVVTKPRNGPHHRKFMALLRVVFENTEKYDNVEDLLTEVKIRTGHYSEYITEEGKVVYLPRSISFSQMDQYQFSELYEKAVQAVIKHLIPNMTRISLDAAVNEVLHFI